MSGLPLTKSVPLEIRAKSFTSEQAQSHLPLVPDWALQDNKIHRDLEFANFLSAVSFINQLAKLAEAEGHHPDIHLTNWNRVQIELYTHSVGGLSEKDFIVAVKTDQIFKNFT